MSYERVATYEDTEGMALADQSTRSSLSSILENINSYEKKNGSNDEEDQVDGSIDTKSPRIYKRRLWIILASISLCLFVLIPFYALNHKNAHSYHNSSDVTLTGQPLSLQDMRKGTFSANKQSIRWIEPLAGADKSVGDFVIFEDEGYYLTSWADRSTRKLLLKSVVEADGIKRTVRSFALNADRTKVIIGTEVVSNWRYSSFAHYWVVDLATEKVEPVYSGHPDEQLSLAEWAPTGDKIAFIFANNLYIRSADGKIDQITQDGGAEIFYGRPDWVYEEEVFGTDRALWWSPSGEYLAFLRTNDSSVPEFPIPYFVQHGVDGKKAAYPEMRYIKYPKPGFDNPIVEILFLELESQDFFPVPVESDPPADDLITEVTWTDAAQVVVRISSRESDILKVSVVDAKERTGKIVRTTDLRGVDGGWSEVEKKSKFVPADEKNGRPEPGYIDTIVIDDGNHLAYFSPVTSSEPKTILTRGKWEVDEGVSSFDAQTNTVYFLSTEQSSIERHLYKVQLDGTGHAPVTNTSETGYYAVDFSGDSRFALLSYNGPLVPWQKVLDLHDDQPFAHGELVEDNKDLKERLKGYDLPTINYDQVKVASKGEDGAEEDIYANTMEILPAGFNPDKKYPVLFYVYGGPGSQNVKKTYGYDFQKILTAHDVIVVVCDGRGTGFKGRKFRTIVRDKLGLYEVKDQITAGKAWASKKYVDEDRIAIWGWSYGGYMTLKTLEGDGGNTFTYGMAVAPPTNWRFYDSIYTERYMHTPEHNEEGYSQSAVRNVTSIGQTERFLVMHGTGDDNVHVQNTMVLLDQLDQSNIENYDVQLFPDSDHSIYYHNANAVVYDKLEHWILDAFGGKFKEFK